MTKPRRSLESRGKMDYRYIADDDGNWYRVANDDMTRAFQSVVARPKKSGGNKYKHVKEHIDNSLEGAKKRDEYLATHDEKGRPIHQGLELVSPEFDIISMSPLIKGGVKYAANKVVDRFGFVAKPNSFTRGIGGIEGLNDLVESGLVRGNPVGTEVTAKTFGKLMDRNRLNFRDIVKDTGIKDIEHRFYRRSLTEEDFNALKQAAKKYQREQGEGIRIAGANTDPLAEYPNYQSYQAQLAKDRQTLANATSLDDSGQPLAYFYDDGRNPITAGHDYAASQYGVRINNASEYNPRIFEGHLHYSMPEAVPLSDSNVEVFRRGPFGITLRVNKDNLVNMTSGTRPTHKYGGIYIKPSKRGTFTAAATKHGMGVQEFASRVLRNKDSYSPAMVKKANFARNASKWNH